MFEDVCNSTVTDTLGLDKDQCQDLNRGILMTPFHNMALMSPAHTIEDVKRHTEHFREAVVALFA